VLPDLESRELSPQDSLRDLGANSIDRSEIIMMTLEALRLRVPLVDLAGARNMGELAALIQARQESRVA
jgi:polyketide biosynthesis acyl carrier protein